MITPFDEPEDGASPAMRARLAALLAALEMRAERERLNARMFGTRKEEEGEEKKTA